MAMYATTDDFLARVGTDEATELTKRETGSLNTTLLQQALKDAGERAESYLAARYTLPLAHAPASLTKAVCDIARWYLAKNQSPEQSRAKNDHDDAVNWLKDLALGKAQLENNGAPSKERFGETPLIKAPKKVFPDAC